jgi:Xaa-Pro aminopeptidase
MRLAKFIYDSPHLNADLYFACRFMAPDPFVFFEYAGRRYLLLSDLEIDRAKKEAEADRFLPLSEYTKKAEKRHKNPSIIDVLDVVFKEKGIKNLLIPANTSFALADALRKKGYKLKAGPRPFYEGRFQKSADEKKDIEAVQKTVFQAMRLAEETLKKSVIRKNKLYYKGSLLTSERMQKMIQIFLFEKGCAADETIVACGAHSIDPHDRGSGPLMPHKPIIVDIFPKSKKTHFYGDATRTFCKGKAPEALKRMYETVKKGQMMAISKVRAGINAKKIHESVLKFFDECGYKTGEKDGRRQGFFHSTGHGLGLELHEEPARIGPRDFILKAGNVLTVEPGLYYKDIGGVRIEDVVYVTKDGCEILSGYPKKLEIR